MTVNNPPWALRGPAATPFPHSAGLARRAFGTAWESAGVITDSGREGSASLAVTANATPNMTVVVSQGEAVIRADGQRAAGDGVGFYLFSTSGVTSVAIGAASTSTRVDLIVAEVIDETYAGATGSSTSRVRAVAGAPGGGVPATPSNAVVLAEVTVQPTDTTVTAARVVDRRVAARQKLQNVVDQAGVIGSVITETFQNLITQPANTPIAFGAVNIVNPVPGRSIQVEAVAAGQVVPSVAGQVVDAWMQVASQKVQTTQRIWGMTAGTNQWTAPYTALCTVPPGTSLFQWVVSSPQSLQIANCQMWATIVKVL